MYRYVHCWWVTILAIEAVRQLGKYFVDRGPHGFQQMVLTDPVDSMYTSAALAQAHMTSTMATWLPAGHATLLTWFPAKGACLRIYVMSFAG